MKIRLDHRLDLRSRRITGIGQRLSPKGLVLLHQIIQRGGEKLLLAAKMKIDDARREPGQRSDMVERQLGITVSADGDDGGLDQLALASLPDWRGAGWFRGLGLVHDLHWAEGLRPFKIT
jgi:hypothetical protein